MATRKLGEPKVGKQEPLGKVNNIQMEKNQPSSANFPDLNKDGKITQADILMGRGVKIK
jgi:hypothetical protein